ncbi:MAG: hypothetical protein M3347_09360 [Armatimonadota bacterium]|nr:hypothetical protein [Armatimonadota bacterium]
MAVTLDVGQCAGCGEKNVKKMQFCRSCGELLPWAKQPKAAKAVDTTKPSALPTSSDIGPILLAGAGGLTFLAGAFFFAGNVLGFFPTFPGLGWLTMGIGGFLFKLGTGNDE